jgi:hypothetical protein
VREPYLARDIRNAVVSALNVAPENLALLHSKTSGLALDNYVARVMQDFTQKGVHAGPNGRKHRNRHELYHATPYGLEFARRSTERLRPLIPMSYAGRLEDRVSATRSGKARELEGDLLTSAPSGSAMSLQVEETTLRFVRDQRVIDWVVDGAHGACEVCKNPAPFCRSEGDPFLEVHHVRPLAEGGPDTVDNAIAVCTNCHRELHHGARRESLRDHMIANAVRLVDHPIKPLGTSHKG